MAVPAESPCADEPAACTCTCSYLAPATPLFFFFLLLRPAPATPLFFFFLLLRPDGEGQGSHAAVTPPSFWRFSPVPAAVTAARLSWWLRVEPH